MLEIPLNANVQCVDGHAGKSSHIIIDPQQRTVTHIVVNDDKSFAARDWLVPIEHIVGSSHELIRLNITLAEVEKLTPFSETRYIKTDEDYYTYAADYMGMEGDYSIPTGSPGYMPVIDEVVPAGERVVMEGAHVEATDGTIGKVGELILDEVGGHITHFTLMEGHFWGKHEVIVPISAVRAVEEGVVHLNLDKKTMKSFPNRS